MFHLPHLGINKNAWEVNISFSSSIHPSLYTYTYTIPGLLALLPTSCFREGEEKRKQSSHKLGLPLSSSSHLQIKLSLATLASCQHGLIFTCSLEPIPPVFCFTLPSFPFLFLNLCYVLFSLSNIPLFSSNTFHMILLLCPS